MDAPIVAVEQDRGPRPEDAPLPPVPEPALPQSSPPVADEEEWQMVTPGGSPRSNSGSGVAIEGHSERHSECSESGAQAELHSLELADSILGNRADAVDAPDVPRLPQPQRLRPAAGEDREEHEAPAVPAAALGRPAAAAPAAREDDSGADAPATPTAAGHANARGAFYPQESPAAAVPPAATAATVAAAPVPFPELAPAGPEPEPKDGAAASAAAAVVAAEPGGESPAAACAAPCTVALRGAGVAVESQLAVLGRWLLESVALMAQGAREGSSAVHGAVVAAVGRLALMLPRTAGCKGGAADAIDWRAVLLGGGFAVSAVAAAYLFTRSWRLRDELHKRDRELAKLVVRIMSLQEVLSTYRRLPVARYTTHHTTTTHAAVTGFAHSMAYL